MANNMRTKLLNLLKECLDEHRSTDHDTPVLKNVIEDDEIQRILREIMETYGDEELTNINDESTHPDDLQDLLDQLRERQNDILSEFQSPEDD